MIRDPEKKADKKVERRLKRQRKWQDHAKKRLFYEQEKTRFLRKDWVVMLAVTVIYAVVAFINLGSTEIPSTYFMMENNRDDVIVEFDQVETIDTIKYVTSFGEGKFSFSYSLDGEGYTVLTGESEQIDENGNMQMTTTPIIAEHKATDMYEWQFIPTAFTAKYVSIKVDDPGIQIIEIGFCGSDGEPVEIASVENLNPDASRGNNPENMFDEQQFVPKQTYYMNEMYFDEVYHARTGYELITHHKIYEVTHPPLGKTILSLGIEAFGMNPFGWRFMGTLFGVFLLPLMYVFAKKLFKKTLYAFIPAFLFAVDFMHYTQTRIATIDSYSVFFIMLMYLFMYLYTEKNYNRQPLLKSLFPLALTGVAFGLGAATKWLCIYAGAGLAVLFFIQLAKRHREYAYAKLVLSDPVQLESMEPGKRAFYEDVRNNYAGKTIKTLLWSLLFFIVVPLIIYLMVYLPYLGAAQDTFGYAFRIFFFLIAAVLIAWLFIMKIKILRMDHAEKAQSETRALPAEDDAEEEPAGGRNIAVRTFRIKRRMLVIAGILVIAVVMLFIYYSSFVLYTDADQGAYGFEDILHNQEYMYHYHSTLSPATRHPFASDWYTWPADVRPVFFFQGQGYTNGYMSSMSTMGNPAVWWGGIAAVIALIVIRIRKGRLGKEAFFITIAALSQYLPWTLISRETFIYHYFATVPFLILLITVLAKYLIEHFKKGKKIVFIYLGICFILFVMFYPVTTGIVVSKAYSDTFLRWLQSWPFY